MALIFRDWLAASESLPLEGIGVLQWKRRPAYISETDSIVYPAHWELCLTVSSETNVPDSVFERLASFSRLSVSEIRNRYNDWMSVLKADNTPNDLFGYGVLIKDERNAWSWSASTLPTLPTASLTRLPEISKLKVGPKRNIGLWLVLVGGLLAVGVVGWTVKQKGCSPEISASEVKTDLTPDNAGTLPYQEIR